MDRNRVTVRYAKALVELASEQNNLDQVSTDIALMFEALNQYEGFAQYILNPGFSSQEKFKKVKSIFGKDFNALTMKFFQLVFDHNREEYLKDLCRNIIDMAHQIKGIVTANLVTASGLDPKIKDRLKSKFEEQLKVTLEMTSEINAELIGGFVFTIDGLQYDASVASKLSGIKKQLQLK